MASAPAHGRGGLPSQKMSRVLATLENFVFIVLLTSLSDMDSRAARAAKRDTARLQEELNAKRPKVDASGKCPDLEASPVKRFQHDSLVPSTHVHIFFSNLLVDSDDLGDDVTDLERERMATIEANKAYLEKLGLMDTKAELRLSLGFGVATTKKPSKGLPPPKCRCSPQ